MGRHHIQFEWKAIGLEYDKLDTPYIWDVRIMLASTARSRSWFCYTKAVNYQGRKLSLKSRDYNNFYIFVTSYDTT